jgi:long-chain acyl-CoA synthetase
VATVLKTLLLPLYLIAKVLVFKKIRATLTMGTAISGGGSLPPHVDKFFQMVGIPVLNGYGLTETSPVLSCRLPDNNILGTVGVPIPGTVVKVVDADTNTQVGPGVKGLVKARGPQVMKGYYKDEAATSKTIDKEGWLDTGDLGWIAPDVTIGAGRRCGGVLVLDGRAKDTIVLLNGENVEPTEIEEAMTQSTLIQHIVVLGQDQRKLGALVVVDKEELRAAAKERMQAKGSQEAEPSDSDLRACIEAELRTYGAGCSHPIASFQLLYEPFTVENGLLTPTMKVRRDVVASKFKEEVQALFR